METRARLGIHFASSKTLAIESEKLTGFISRPQLHGRIPLSTTGISLSLPLQGSLETCPGLLTFAPGHYFIDLSKSL